MGSRGVTADLLSGLLPQCGPAQCPRRPRLDAGRTALQLPPCATTGTGAGTHPSASVWACSSQPRCCCGRGTFGCARGGLRAGPNGGKAQAGAGIGGWWDSLAPSSPCCQRTADGLATRSLCFLLPSRHLRPHPLPPPPHATRPLPLSTYQHVGKVVLGPIENPQPHNRAHGGAGAGLPLGHSGRRPPAKRAAAAGGVRRRWAGHAAERQRGRGWREGVYSEEKRKKRTQTNTALDMVLFVEGKVGEGERQRHRGPQTSSGGGRGVCTDRGGFAE